ncbi:ferritin-like domain-containing protein [Herbidospora sp. RD11066]
MPDDKTWLADFEAEAARRKDRADPDWHRGSRLHPDVLRSIRRFQVGENGDGANLIAKAAASGNPAYAATVRLFVDEERNHARMLAMLLAAAGSGTLTGHWSDTVFVWLRRLLGLRLELMVLMIAEVVALRYYRALRDGTGDPLTTEAAALILADEERHVPFHTDRLRHELRDVPLRGLVVRAWWVLLFGTVAVVIVDHGRALRRLGLPWRDFARDVTALFGAVVRASCEAPRGPGGTGHAGRPGS